MSRAALLRALGKAIRRGGAESYDRLAQMGESGAFSSGLGALLMGGPPAAFEALDQGVVGAQPQTDGDFTMQRDMAAAGSAYGGAAGLGLGAFFGEGRRALLRQLAREGGKQGMARYIRYLRDVGFDEEAHMAEFAVRRARTERRRGDTVGRGMFADDASTILGRIERAEPNARRRRTSDETARREAEALLDYYARRERRG